MAENSQAGGDAQANSTAPTLTASGADTNVSHCLTAKGEGSVALRTKQDIDVAAIRAAAIAEANAASAARAKAIGALCDLAGVPARATAFITEGKSEAEVRDTLLAERAKASTEGGEISGTRGAAPPAGSTASNAVAAAASWDRIGRAQFGAAWKGI